MCGRSIHHPKTHARARDTCNFYEQFFFVLFFKDCELLVRNDTKTEYGNGVADDTRDGIIRVYVGSVK